MEVQNAGQVGFGVGLCPDEALAKVHAQKLEDTDVLGSNDYGNYRMSDGSIMVFIPAFVYKEDNGQLKVSYDTSLKDTEGWILHRAFVNNGKQLKGFFIDKYLCSPSEDNKSVQSVKNADPLTLSLKGSRLIDNDRCVGQVQDAYVLVKTRGKDYCVVSCFAYSALRMLSLAHAQASTDATNCAWYDEKYCFVKGNTNYLKDSYDDEVVYTVCDTFPYKRGKTGSGTPFAKTTHNGQNCGVADLNGNVTEIGIGVTQNADMQDTQLYVFKDSADLRDLTIDNVLDCDTFYEGVPFSNFEKTQFGGAWEEGVYQFSNESSGINWALTGVYPLKVDLQKKQVKYLQGEYTSTGVARKYTRCVFSMGGTFMEGKRCGLWYTSNKSHNNGSLSSTGFRCMLLVE